MPSWRLRNLLNVRLLAGLLCLTGMGMAAGAGPTGATHPRESQPADKTYEIVRMSKPDGTVVEMRVPRHRSLLAKRPAGPRGTIRQLPGTAAAGEEPSETPQIGGRRAVRLQQAPAARASSEGPSRPSSGRVVTQRANPQRADTGARISHPYTGSRQLTSGAVDVMRPTAVPRGGAVSQTPVVASDNASEWRTGLGWVPNNEDDDTGRYLSSDDAFAELVPGDGWDGPTDDPDPVGNDSMPGWDAKAIARWDVVPYQTFDEEFHIGVVAFHMNGIDRVEFSVDGGPWVSVEEMQLNPRTDVWEYTAVLHPEYFDEDGLVEVRAIVWPEGAGQPRLLAGDFDYSRSYRGSVWTGEHSLYVSSNYRGTLTDEVVELPAGDYVWGEAPLYFGSQLDKTRWLTYRPAPGVQQSDVRIIASASTYPRERDFKRIRLQGLTMLTADLGWFADDDDMIWFDGVNVTGPGQWLDSGGFARINHQWWTSSSISDNRCGFAKHFVRSCSFRNIGEDVVRESYLVLNSAFHNIDSGPTEWHSGIIANKLLHDNRIYYGLRMTDIGNSRAWPMRNGTHDYWENRDVAIINCHSQTSADNQIWYVGADTDHLFVENCTFFGKFQWRVSTDIPEYQQFDPTNVVITQSILNGDPSLRPDPHPLDGVTFIEYEPSQ